MFRERGEETLIPLRRVPECAPNQTAAALEDEIVAWRKLLAEDGFDADATTIHYHLSRVLNEAPSLRMIHRVLVCRGFVTPQRQKRPRSSWVRFESVLPNECLQSDTTYPQLEDETPVKIINFIDNYGRGVLARERSGASRHGRRRAARL